MTSSVHTVLLCACVQDIWELCAIYMRIVCKILYRIVCWAVSSYNTGVCHGITYYGGQVNTFTIELTFAKEDKLFLCRQVTIPWGSIVFRGYNSLRVHSVQGLQSTLLLLFHVDCVPESAILFPPRIVIYQLSIGNIVSDSQPKTTIHKHSFSSAKSILTLLVLATPLLPFVIFLGVCEDCD